MGFPVRVTEGCDVGAFVGPEVGIGVGAGAGCEVGTGVGIAVGAGVGCGVGAKLVGLRSSAMEALALLAVVQWSLSWVTHAHSTFRVITSIKLQLSLFVVVSTKLTLFCFSQMKKEAQAEWIHWP